jgi:hypothetical protein
MGEVFIPLGGAGGKSRGSVVTLDGNTPFANRGATLSLPLPAGTYKKSLTTPSTSYGDGKNAEVTLSKGLLKKMALNAFGIASITNFSLSMFAHKQVRLTWARPSQGLWSGVHFVFKYDSVPTSVTDGFMQVDSADVYYTTSLLQERRLYVRAYNYVTTNEGRWYDSGNVSSTIQVTGVSGSVTFGAGAGTWTVPANVRRVRYILVGRGGDGGWGNYYVPGGGGGGGYFTTGYMDVTPGQNIPWVIPTVKEQSTSFNGVIANAGHEPGQGGFSRGNNGHKAGGGNGGSGGSAWGGTPGTNGNDGVGATNRVNIGSRHDKEFVWLDGCTPGIGQHSPTTGFNGVLYSSGGYAGSKGNRAYGAPGTNGLGNGGNGASHSSVDNELDGGNGGTGCIYIAWGSLMNDGS